MEITHKKIINLSQEELFYCLYYHDDRCTCNEFVSCESIRKKRSNNLVFEYAGQYATCFYHDIRKDCE